MKPVTGEVGVALAASGPIREIHAWVVTMPQGHECIVILRQKDGGNTSNFYPMMSAYRYEMEELAPLADQITKMTSAIGAGTCSMRLATYRLVE